MKQAEGARVLNVTKETDAQDNSFAAQVEVENIRSGVIYENLFPGTDVEYILSGSSLKENIIVEEKQDVYEYTFGIKTNKIDIRQEEDGSILFLKEGTEEVLYIIPEMYMWDANGKESDAVETEIITKNKKSTLVIRADAEWINTEERVFPITIDPTLEATSTSTGSETRIVRNMYVTEGNPTAYTSGYGRGFLGYDGSGDETYRLFVQFKTLPTIPKSSVIASAKFYYAHEAYDYVRMSKLTIAAKEVTESWSWGQKVTWNSQPAFSNTILDYQVMSDDTVGTYVGWDITKLIKNHYENKDNTTNVTSAFVLVGTEEGSYAYNYVAKANVVQENSSGFFSNAQPVLQIVYRDTRGLEDYYTYQVQGLGKAGTGYTGDYTKELTVIRPIFQTNSVVMPFQLSLIYNSSLGNSYFGSNAGLNTKNYNYMKVGYGWKVNIQETVIEKTIGGKKYLIYNDSDGTDHYFPLESGNTYKDEDGLKLTITKSTSPIKYTMMDEKGNQKIFHNGFLSTVKDANGNAIYLLYNDAEYSTDGTWYADTGSTNRVTKIVQINKGQSEPTVLATFYYKDTTFLHYVIDYAGRTYIFKYTVVDSSVNGYNLTQIVDPDRTYGKYVYYLVSTDKVNKLACTYDSETKLGISYIYKITNHSSRLSRISEIRWTSDKDYVQGKTVDITNTELLQTYYRDRGLDCTVGTTDDIWTYYTFDNAGRTISQVSMDSSKTYYYGASANVYGNNSGTANGNQLLSSVAVGTGGVNILRNGGCEIITDSKPRGWTDTKTLSTDTQNQMTITFDGEGAVRTGELSFRVMTEQNALPDTDGSLGACLSNVLVLESGVPYTFSGYFHNTEAENFNDKSRVYLKVSDSNGANVAISSVITECTSEEIENGWSRLVVTFIPVVAGTYTVSGCIEWVYGNSCFDDFQLEKGSTASTYNYFVNGSVESYDGWYYTTGGSRVNGNQIHGTYAIKIVGSPSEKRTASVAMPLNISSDTTLVLSGWAKASSVAGITKDSPSQRAFGLEINLTYRDGTTETHYASFDGSSSQLQYTSLNIVPKKSGTIITKAIVRCVYGKNANTAYFDSISLKAEPVACYKYDSDGNVVAVTASEQDKVDFTYSAGNLIRSQSEGSGVYDYTYDDNHNLTKVSNDGVDMTLTYDSMGHVKTTKVQNTASQESRSISTSAAYSTNGDYLTAQTDALGNTVSYETNSYGLTASVTDALDHKVFYTYNTSNNRLSEVSTEDGTSVSYIYTDGTLSSIIRDSLLPDGVTEIGQSYSFTYDVYDNVISVKTGEKTLVSYEYMANNGPLTKITYENGFYIEYEQDALGRTVAEKHNGVLKYQYNYGSEGYLSYQKELDADGNVIKVTGYEYDSLGRMIRSWEEGWKDGVLVRGLSTEHLYDTSNRLVKQSWTTETSSRTESYVYDSDDGTLSSMTTSSGNTVSYTYDYLKRLQQRSDGTRNLSYTYKDIGSNGTSTQISEISWTGLGESSLSLEYEYDALWNITKVTENGETLAEYTYDAQSQLIREELPQSHVEYDYSYDTGGNIRSVSVTENGTKMIRTYSYTDSDWKDLLTAVDGNNLTYDEIGNPLTYYNGKNWTFTWSSGRKLTGAVSDNTTVSYVYDSDEIRSSKTANGEEHSYVYLGGVLVEETWGNNVLKFSYDEQGRPYAVDYNGSMYYYIVNQQGDVVRIIDGSGNLQAEYVYNAWGKILEIRGECEIREVNPLRYRGYYYDAETGFYYVSSRYYDPEVGRFISADTTDVLSADHQKFAQYNLYAYCWNNPVNMVDETGTWPNWAKVVVGAVSTVAAVTLSVATGGAALPILASVALSTVSGAIGGYITGGKQGAIDGAANGFMVGGLSSLVASAISAVKTISIYKKTIDSYSALQAKYKGSGMQAHHVIEKRLAEGSSWKISKMPSIEITPTVHQGYTKAWRNAVKYGTRYTSGLAYKYQLYKASNSIYSGSRVLRMAARYTIWKM